MAGTSLRRSSRERKQTQSFYEDAEKQEEDKERSSISPAKKRKRRIKDPEPKQPEVEEEDESSVATEDENPLDDESQEEEEPKMDAADEAKMVLEEELSGSEDDSKDEDEYTPSKKSQKKAKSSTPSPPKRSPVKARKSKVPTSTKKPKKAAVAGKRKPARKAVQSALATLANKILDDSEKPTKSLLADLLYSFKARDPSAEDNNMEFLAKYSTAKQSPYTKNLAEVAMRVIDEHNDDPNSTQVALYNLLFRSVGTNVDFLLDPDEIDLENCANEEFDACLNHVVKGMEQTPIEHVLLLVEGSSGRSSVAAEEYQSIYREFWYLLAAIALSDSLSGNTTNAPPIANSDDESDDDDESKDDLGQHVPQGYRFQLEMVREILRRMIEVSCLGQGDLRAGTVIAVYQMGIAILERTVELKDKLATAERQLKVAKKARMKVKSETLQAQVDSWSRMNTELESLVTETIMGLFMKRYKDTVPQIRAISMECMSRFMLIRPDVFFTNSYMKYLGWMLSDKSPIVREKALTGLLAPFKANEEISNKRGRGQSSKKRIDTTLMTMIATKFCSRIADCTMDVEVVVQERATELLLAFSRDLLLEKVDDAEIWKQINSRALADDTSPKVRRMALMFVIEQLQAFDEQSVSSEADAVERINALITWVTHCIAANKIPLEKIPFHLVGHVVSSLRQIPEHAGLVTNYSAILRAVQECGSSSASQSSRRLESIQRRLLLEMLASAAEQEMSSLDEKNLSGVVDPDYLAAQKSGKDQTKEKKKRGSEGSQEAYTVSLLKALPDLLETYKTENSLIRHLTALPKYFLPSALNTSSQKKYFSSLLQQLSAIFHSASDEIVLANCCLSVTLLAKGDHTRSSDALVALKRDAAKVVDTAFDLIDEKAEAEDQKDLIGTEEAFANCLRRLLVISKRWDLSELIKNGTDIIEKLFSAISEAVARDLNDRKPATDEDDEENAESLIAEVWETAPNEVHLAVMNSATFSFGLLLSLLSWGVLRFVNSKDKEKDESDMIAQMRDRLVKLLGLAFDNYIDEEKDSFSTIHRTFARRVQLQALITADDLRALLPKEYDSLADPSLKALAFKGEGTLIAGAVRLLEMSDHMLRNLKEKEQSQLAQNLLMPLCRSLTANWKEGHRRECGEALLHITGSGQEASSMMSALSKVLKKIHPVRLLEAHMAGLRATFEPWMEDEPAEPEGDNPPAEEMELYDELAKQHKKQFELMEQRAKRLSNSLGVGKTDAALEPMIVGFVKEGVRVAFDTNDPRNPDMPLFLGQRLPFLKLVSKYLPWVRRRPEDVENLRNFFNEKEAELRNHPEFGEVFSEDIQTMSQFRKLGNLGAFLVEDNEDDDKTKEDESEAASTQRSQARRLSNAGSVASQASSIVSKATQPSLPSLPEHAEEDEQEQEDDMDTDDGEE